MKHIDGILMKEMGLKTTTHGRCIRRGKCRGEEIHLQELDVTEFPIPEEISAIASIWNLTVYTPELVTFSKLPKIHVLSMEDYFERWLLDVPSVDTVSCFNFHADTLPEWLCMSTNIKGIDIYGYGETKRGSYEYNIRLP